MKRMTKWTVLWILLFGLAGAQTTSDRLESLQQTLRQQKNLNDEQVGHLKELGERLKNLSYQQRKALTQLETLDAEVANLNNEISKLATDIIIAERDLRETGERSLLANRRVALLQQEAIAILRSLYRERGGRYLSLLSQSENLPDLMIRLEYHNRAGKRNITVMNELAIASESLRAQQALQQKQTSELKALQQSRKTKLDDLARRRKEQRELITQLKRTQQGQQAIALQKQAQQALTVQSIDTLVGEVIKERSRIEQERRRKLEEERQRRLAEAKRLAEEAKRLAEEAERQRQEALRLKRLQEEQRALQAKLAAQRREEQRQQAEREQRATAQAAKAQAERQAQLGQHRLAVKARQEQLAREEKQSRENEPMARRGAPLRFPLQGGRVSQPFGTDGNQWTVLSGGGNAVAAQDGFVLAATYYASLGWVILVDHGGTVTGYFGLKTALTSVGARVTAGMPLGAVGGSPIFGEDKMAFQLREGGEVVAPTFR